LSESSIDCSSWRFSHPENDESQDARQGGPAVNSPRSDLAAAKNCELEAFRARVELLEAALASEQERYDADMQIRIDGAFGAHEAMAAVTGAMLARSVINAQSIGLVYMVLFPCFLSLRGLHSSLIVPCKPR